jgi:hypothetical protein
MGQDKDFILKPILYLEKVFQVDVAAYVCFCHEIISIFDIGTLVT